MAHGAPPPSAVIDLLVASTTSKPRESRAFGTPSHLGVTEVRGLSFAFKRPSIVIEVSLERRNGEVIEARLDLPDEAAALIVKVGARQSRRQSKDAFDVYRCLHVARAAGVTAADLADGAAAEQVRVLTQDVGTPKGPGLDALASYPSAVTARCAAWRPER